MDKRLRAPLTLAVLAAGFCIYVVTRPACIATSGYLVADALGDTKCVETLPTTGDYFPVRDADGRIVECE